MSLLLAFVVSVALALALGLALRAGLAWRERRRLERYLRSLPPLDPLSARVCLTGPVTKDVR